MRRHLQTMLAALAMGLLVALVSVGRARAADLPLAPSPTDSHQYEISRCVHTSVNGTRFSIDA